MTKKRSVQLVVGNGSPLVTDKVPGRNDPCKCGSGKKAKNCCGTAVKYFHSNSTEGKALNNKPNEPTESPDKKV